MKSGGSIQCSSCGAPVVSEYPAKPILTCESCGSEINYQRGQSNQAEPTKPIRLTLMVVFWVIFQNTRKQAQITQPVSMVSAPSEYMAQQNNR